MWRSTLVLLAAIGLPAAPQVVKKTEDAVEKGARKTAVVTKAVAKETLDGTRKAAKKTGELTGTAADKTLAATKSAGKTTAKVARTVGNETVDVTKTGARNVVDIVDLKKKSPEPKVNLNTASRAELIALPGIGEANADKIIKARPIAKVEDLSTRKIIQAQYYEKVKGLVSVK